jgi:transcriptional regulator with XRE-family HTH domain
MSAHHPAASARRRAGQLVAGIGAEIDRSRATLGRSIEEVARRAVVSPSTVVRVFRGDPGVHLDTLCAVAHAAGLRITLKAYPEGRISLRDTGQLRIAEYLAALAHPSLRPAMELPVGDPFGRAADIVFFGPDEILHQEVERRLSDLQETLRSATVKRDALQARHHRPVRLILVVTDTARNRELVGPHSTLVRRVLPASSAQVLHAMRTGTTLGQDGFLWVRPWRPAAAKDSAGPDSSGD